MDWWSDGDSMGCEGKKEGRKEGDNVLGRYLSIVTGDRSRMVKSCLFTALRLAWQRGGREREREREVKEDAARHLH